MKEPKIPKSVEGEMDKEGRDDDNDEDDDSDNPVELGYMKVQQRDGLIKLVKQK
ncbi:MAG: hypothetical protein Q8755_02690 [Candidatus Phytoplasma australasiaticum]|nr:hypothetical protein [Candidatus Phytoplasma australasiaticum]